MSDVSRNMASHSCTVVDAPKVFGILVLTVLFLAIGVYLLLVLEVKPADDTARRFWGYLFMAFFILSAIKFKVESKGYVIDVENNIFEFPGGGIAADSFLSYFNPIFWLQGFQRHQRPLSEIRQAEAYQETSKREYTDSQGRRRVRTIKLDKLDISGDFGAISFYFASKGKRDQLYSAIIQLNEMGSPVLRR